MSAQSDAFDRAATLLAGRTGLTAPQARGTIRLGLKEGGFDPREVTPAELAVVFQRLMPKRLEAQGRDPIEAQSICADIAALIAVMPGVGPRTAAAAMFARLDDARRAR